MRGQLRSWGFVGLLMTAFGVAACSSRGDEPTRPQASQGASPAASNRTPAKRPSRPGLPTKVNPPLAALPPAPQTDSKKVALGERLYNEPRLSGDGTVTCASCHQLNRGGTDSPLRVSRGIHGQDGPINSPTTFNSTFSFVQFWDGRARTLEEQAAGPVENPKEMGASWPVVVRALQADPTYVSAFAEAYPDGLTQANITHAIAEYERTLVTPARFDRFAAGEVGALTEDEREGLSLFVGTGCTSCHDGPLLGGRSFQRMGNVTPYFPARGGELTEADQGRFNVTRQEADRHFFKVPTLRNVELTPPYFHDGFASTLEQAVTLMARHQLGKELRENEVAKIVLFLKSLTGERLPTRSAAAAPNAPAAAPTAL